METLLENNTIDDTTNFTYIFTICCVLARFDEFSLR